MGPKSLEILLELINEQCSIYKLEYKVFRRRYGNGEI
jgi:hypothetical protein